MFKSLLLVLMLVVSLAASAAEPGDYVASAEGRLTIGADGRVQDVRIIDGKRLGGPMLAALEQQVRAWEFEPVLEAGTPVAVVGLMRLELFLQRQPADDSIAFGVRRVWFIDPPGPASGKSHQGQEQRMTPPMYPAQQQRQGVGAQLELMVRLDADGRVEEVTTKEIQFIGRAPEARLDRHAAAFQREAEDAAKGWRIPGYSEGMVVRVPVKFTPGSAGTWVPRFAAPSPTLPAWAVAALGTRGLTVDLAASGQRVSDRFQLLTPLQPTGG